MSRANLLNAYPYINNVNATIGIVYNATIGIVYNGIGNSAEGLMPRLVVSSLSSQTRTVVSYILLSKKIQSDENHKDCLYTSLGHSDTGLVIIISQLTS